MLINKRNYHIENMVRSIIDIYKLNKDNKHGEAVVIGAIAEDIEEKYIVLRKTKTDKVGLWRFTFPFFILFWLFGLICVCINWVITGESELTLKPFRWISDVLNDWYYVKFKR